MLKIAKRCWKDIHPVETDPFGTWNSVRSSSMIRLSNALCAWLIDKNHWTVGEAPHFLILTRLSISILLVCLAGVCDVIFQSYPSHIRVWTYGTPEILWSNVIFRTFGGQLGGPSDPSDSPVTTERSKVPLSPSRWWLWLLGNLGIERGVFWVNIPHRRSSAWYSLMPPAFDSARSHLPITEIKPRDPFQLFSGHVSNLSQNWKRFVLENDWACLGLPMEHFFWGP